MNEEELEEKKKRRKKRKKKRKVKKKKGKRDACYHKVKARYRVWPSAYASGALVKCRRVGAKNWGNKSKKNESINEEFEPHKMYHPETGEEVDANTKEDHIKYDKKGYVHEKPKKVKKEGMNKKTVKVKIKRKLEEGI